MFGAGFRGGSGIISTTRYIAGLIDVYPRRKLMRRIARDLVQTCLLDEDQPVPQNAWIGAVSLQALAYKRGQPLVVLSERKRPSANSVFRSSSFVEAGTRAALRGRRSPKRSSS